MKLKSVMKRVVHDKYINSINQSKIAIISVNCFQSPNMKFTEFTSCGTLVLSDQPDDMKELGFKNNKHLVIYNNINDLKDKINYFLKNEKEREIIAKQGMEFTRKTHNNIIRTKEMFSQIEKEIM